MAYDKTGKTVILNGLRALRRALFPCLQAFGDDIGHIARRRNDHLLEDIQLCRSDMPEQEQHAADPVSRFWML